MQFYSEPSNMFVCVCAEDRSNGLIWINFFNDILTSAI